MTEALQRSDKRPDALRSAQDAPLLLGFCRVLLVDNDSAALRPLERKLTGMGLRVLISKGILDAQKVLEANDVSLVLTSLKLSDGDGRELLIKIRKTPRMATLPVFIFAAHQPSKIQKECFALGADACFQRTVDPAILAMAVAARLRRGVVTARHPAQDPLTGLSSRTTFANAFTRAARLATRSQQPMSIAMLDVDRFKAVNDLYGHAMGDEVLRRLARVLIKNLRASDMASRWGGEEFAIFFQNTTVAAARLALTKGLAAFRAEQFTTADGETFHATFSAGIARVQGTTAVDPALAEADRFLYIAKGTGRDRVVTEADNTSSLKKNILLIEDDKLTAMIIKELFRKNGYKAIHARNSQEAIKAVSESSISCITLDVRIPGLDGFELLECFRKIPSLRQVPILMVTSAGSQDDIIRGFNLGADDYLLKPFAPPELLARVRRFLQKS